MWTGFSSTQRTKIYFLVFRLKILIETRSILNTWNLQDSKYERKEFLKYQTTAKIVSSKYFQTKWLGRTHSALSPEVYNRSKYQIWFKNLWATRIMTFFYIKATYISFLYLVCCFGATHGWCENICTVVTHLWRSRQCPVF